MPLNLLRVRHPHEHSRVTFVELFFDLVFVFAVTQLSHFLAHDLTVIGAVHTGLLLTAVWIVWIYTSWATNWLDPDTIPVRLLIFGIMFGGLILSASIPGAFADKGLGFAVPLVVIQIGRTAFVVFAMRGDPNAARNMTRVTLWLAVSGIFWVAGGFATGESRIVLWLIALAFDFTGPTARFWTPGLGRSSIADWNVEGGHMAERCGLFIIIALGESILVAGASFAGSAWTAPVIGAFVASFIGSVAMWWIYFNTTAEHGTQIISHARDPGRLARSAYTYVHLPIVAGIIVTAVGDEATLAHPTGDMDLGTALVILAGPAIYLAGTALFKWTIMHRIAASHVAAIVVLAVLFGFRETQSALSLSAIATIVVVAIALWDSLAMKTAATIEDTGL